MDGAITIKTTDEADDEGEGDDEVNDVLRTPFEPHYQALMWRRTWQSSERDYDALMLMPQL